MDLRLNSLQTDIEALGLKDKPQEIQDQFYSFLDGVPFIRSLVSPDRPYAKDLLRDSDGKIVVDITKPHILEDMDYFRPAAIHFQKYGCYTDLRPNPNPNSEFGKWFREEVRRCREGYVRPSDGEWVTGDYYFFLNYTPMLVSRTSEGSRFAQRVIDFPSVWEGHYYKSHYLDQARKYGLHAAELSRRGCGKSFFGAALLAKRFLLGESEEVRKKVVSYIIAFDKAKLIGGDQTLDKFQYDIDFCAENTQFPSKRLLNSIQNMQWQSGYLDLNSGAKKGTLNSVIGKAYNDASKLRGSRGVLYLFEEAGSFPNLLESYNNLLPSVEDGSNVFGTLYLYGTSGDEQSDFAALQEIMYNPKGYHVYGVDNVYDMEGQGRKVFTSFFPGYLNRANCYDENGNSDVTKALLEILEDRYNVKYNSTDVNSITKRIAEIPITPQEAILRTRGNLFPVTDLSNRLNEIDNNPRFYDDVYTGSLVMNSSGAVEYVPTDHVPIREFPLKDSMNVNGAVEIYALPEKNSDGKVPFDRYVAGLDPIEDDESGGNHSLMSLFILDLWTDRIVYEYTGRHPYADDCYEEVRKALLFYNARCLYESNVKGIFAYFSKMNCLYLLADTPEYLRDKDLVKIIGYGNKSKGYHATQPLNNYADTLIRNWLIQPVTLTKVIDGEEQEVTMMNLYRIKNRALLKEAMLYNSDGNFDRIRAIGACMLYREEKMIQYQGNFRREDRKSSSYKGNDDFFTRNYEGRFKKFDELYGLNK